MFPETIAGLSVSVSRILCPDFKAHILQPMDDMEFNELKEKLGSYTPAMPESVLDFYLEKCGVTTLDGDVKKMISLMSHKFLTDVAVGAFQYHKIFSKAAQKDKRFGKEKKVTLQVQDLEKALKDMGIDISRPSYYM